VLLLGLVQWSIAALQTVAQAAPASAAVPAPFLATLFRGIAVLQLDEVLLPPAVHRGVRVREPGAGPRCWAACVCLDLRCQACHSGNLCMPAPGRVGVMGAALLLALF